MQQPKKMNIGDILSDTKKEFGEMWEEEYPPEEEAEKPEPTVEVPQPPAQMPEVRKNQAPESAIDYETYMRKAVELFKSQMQLGENPGVVDIASLELSEAKANSFLNALNNIISVGHLTTLVEADGMKFERAREMEAMNPLLRSFSVAANSSERVVGYISRQMDRTIDKIEDLERSGVFLRNTVCAPIDMGKSRKGDEGGRFVGDAELLGAAMDPENDPNMLLGHVGNLHSAFTGAVDNLTKITEGVSKVINLERSSGGRPMGNSRIGIPSSGAGGSLRRLGGGGGAAARANQALGAIAGDIGSAPREMSSAELMEILRRQREDEQGPGH